MRWWTPRPDEPELLDWYRSLLAFAQRARDEQVPWPIRLEEFRCAGRVDRRGGGSIWVYEHRVNGGELLVDEAGRPYRFIVHRRGSSPGRFAEVELRRAVWAARLPDVVEPVWYEPPVRRDGWCDRCDGADDEPESYAGGAGAGAAGAVAAHPAGRSARREARGASSSASSTSPGGGVRRGHLRLVVPAPDRPHRSA